MSLDQLKTGWSSRNPDTKSATTLKALLSENRHPVLKGIRRQLIFESILLTIFLVVYYDGFDGEKKPLFANGLLVLAVLLVLVHNILGYFAARRVISGPNLYQSLLGYRLKLKRYGLVSVASRAVMVICLLVFFMNTVNLQGNKWITLAAMVSLVPLQVWLLGTIWRNRIRQISHTLSAFGES